MGDNFLLITMSICTYSFITIIGEVLNLFDRTFKMIYSTMLFLITLFAIFFSMTPVVFGIILSIVAGGSILYKTKNLFFSVVLFSIIKLANTVIWFATFEFLMVIYHSREVSTEKMLQSVVVLVGIMGILYGCLLWGLVKVNKKYKLLEFILESDKKNYLSAGFLLGFSIVGDFFNLGLREAIAKAVTGHFVAYFFELLIFIVVVNYLIIKDSLTLLYFKEEKKYSQSLKRELFDLKGFKHDYKNILLSMKSLIENKEYERLERYFFDELLPEADSVLKEDIVQQLHTLATPETRSLILEKYADAEHHNIPFIVDIEPDNLPIEKCLVKINRLIGILLDNAIEESKNVEYPMIYLKVFMEKGTIVFQVSNKTVLKKVNLMKKVYSSKGENRGFGLISFSKIVKELAHVDYSINSNNYRIDCYLYIRNYH